MGGCSLSLSLEIWPAIIIKEEIREIRFSEL
jgi:hypothetical protein